MIIEFHPSFMSLADAEIHQYSASFERLLGLHRDRKLLVALSPREIIRFRAAMDLGALSKSVLALIEKRAQDYASVARRIGSKVLVVPDIEPHCITTDSVLQDHLDKVLKAMESPSRLFVENSSKDGQLYTKIIETFLAEQGFPAEFLRVESFHGGGDTLAAAMNLLDGSVRGLCVCDRDTFSDIPPFRAGKTSTKVMKVLSDWGFCSVSKSQIQHSNLFFRFQLTFGWSLENYIGPNLLWEQLDSDHTLRAFIPAFRRVFPNFPNLSLSEWQIWRSVCFRSPEQDQTALLAHLHSLYPEMNEDVVSAACELTFPGTTVEWAILNWEGSRMSKSVRSAFRKDLLSADYFAWIKTIAETAAPLFVSDRRMATS